MCITVSHTTETKSNALRGSTRLLMLPVVEIVSPQRMEKRRVDTRENSSALSPLWGRGGPIFLDP